MNASSTYNRPSLLLQTQLLCDMSSQRLSAYKPQTLDNTPIAISTGDMRLCTIAEVISNVTNNYLYLTSTIGKQIPLGVGSKSAVLTCGVVFMKAILSNKNK